MGSRYAGGEHRVEDGAQRMIARPATWSCGREMSLPALPLGVR